MSAIQAASPGRKQRPYILVVSGHPILRKGFTHVISLSGRFRLSGEAATVSQAIQQCKKTSPDAILVDLSPPTDITITAVQDCRSIIPSSPVLVVSTEDERIFAERVMRAGAHGYVMAQAEDSTLMEALWSVATGHYFVGRSAVEAWAKSFASKQTRKAVSTLSELSNREIEIFQLLGQGKSVVSISNLLHISPRTVDVHRTNIRQKLEFRSATDLLCFAIRWVESQKNSRDAQPRENH